MHDDAAAELERRRREVIAEAGPWTAHNIHLGSGVFTIGERVVGQERRLGPLLQVAEDTLGGIEGRSVLDLACMEGLFAVEFARQGAKVVGIEGRAGHVARADFARRAIGLGDLSFVQGDVRDVDPGSYGQFDLVLALGILYHLDAPDLFPFVRLVAELTRRVAIVDTHYSLRARHSWEDNGSTYWGTAVREHDPSDSADERERASGSSLDTLSSAWLTKPSLFNLLSASGFTTVSELRIPLTYGNWDRVVLVAIKGNRRPEPLSAPQLEPESAEWPEESKVWVSPQQSKRGQLARRIPALMPAPLRRALLARRRARREGPG